MLTGFVGGNGAGKTTAMRMTLELLGIGARPGAEDRARTASSPTPPPLVLDEATWLIDREGGEYAALWRAWTS